jgi:hypothetical protein
VRGRVSADQFAGKAMVEWLDAWGQVAGRQEVDIDGPKFTATFSAAPGWGAPAAASVRVYAWDPVAGVDAAGQASLGAGSAAASATVTP